MAINSSAIASKSVTDQDVPAVVENLSVEPIPGEVFTPSRPPGQLCAFYNGSTNSMNLYVVSGTGNRWLRVT